MWCVSLTFIYIQIILSTTQLATVALILIYPKGGATSGQVNNRVHCEQYTISVAGRLQLSTARKAPCPRGSARKGGGLRVVLGEVMEAGLEPRPVPSEFLSRVRYRPRFATKGFSDTHLPSTKWPHYRARERSLSIGWARPDLATMVAKSGPLARLWFATFCSPIRWPFCSFTSYKQCRYNPHWIMQYNNANHEYKKLHCVQIILQLSCLIFCTHVVVGNNSSEQRPK